MSVLEPRCWPLLGGRELGQATRDNASPGSPCSTSIELRTTPQLGREETREPVDPLASFRGVGVEGYGQ
jgi:hypothetical protein